MARAVHAAVAVLLLILMPLGLLHRASTGGCRSEHPGAVAASAAAGADLGLDGSSATWADHEHTIGGEPHDHAENERPLIGAPPSACGPGALAQRAAPAGVSPDTGGIPAWRAFAPLALAAPPPAPPPRLT